MVRMFAIVLSLVLPLAACDNTTRLQIESDTKWRALIERDEIGGSVTHRTPPRE